MNITQKHKYGLAAMVQLGFNYQKGPIQLRVISDAAGIPHAYLEHLILDLKKAGLVVSTRGAKGGYQLRSLGNVAEHLIFYLCKSLELKVRDSYPQMTLVCC